MSKRVGFICTFVLLLGWAIVAQKETVEAVEVGRHNTDLLPAGKEADGIPGDFVLRNKKVHALISGAQPLRRANMSTEYAFVTQGVLYDLDLRDATNDQITAFRPGGLGGEISYVRVVEDGSRGAGVIEAVRTAALGDGLYTRHEYRLEPGWQYILVTSTYRNESRELKKVTLLPAWKAFSAEWNAAGIQVGDSIDPFDKRAYAFAAVGGPLEPAAELQPLEERTVKVALAVADSPAAAWSLIAALRGATGEVSATVRDPTGEPALHGALMVPIGGQRLPAYPDAKGAISLRLPPGSYEATFEDIGRDPVSRAMTVSAGGTTRLDLAVGAASLVRMDIRDEHGAASPARVQFIGIEGTPTPNFGTEYRAHGGNHQYQTHDGRVRQQVPPGRYLLRITHGPEYDLVEKTVEVAKGRTVDVPVTLRRTVDTAGWISADYHAHSTPSGDNYCNTVDRLINFAAENLEFIPTTEHNRIYTWAPLIDKLGLSARLKTVAGMELTGGGQHFNAFPLNQDRHAQNGGAPLWSYDPRINAIVLRNWGTPSLAGGSRYDTEANARLKGSYFGGGADRWVQANHPSVGNVFFDRDGNGVPDGGFTGFEELLDGAEVWSTEILNLGPTYNGKGVSGAGNHGLQNRTFGWLQMLNQGRRVWCVAVSDAHRVFGNGVGGWRTYVPSAVDEPARIDPSEIIRNSKAGRMMLTNGPFLKVTTGDGLPIGSTVVSEGHIDLKIVVKAANWIGLDRVQVLVNGRQPKAYNFTRQNHPEMFQTGVLRFDQTVRVKLEQDAHLIVVATGENADLADGWGLNLYGKMHPIAYTNPIFVDVNHNGWKANGDTLGHPLLVTPGR
ncbi:MAG: carboxypeptidase regulatory-like domain-containing protein [Acidobacteria bacterium]|nr:carboxypeptidase regulatory-like domain-containing protein [Acidobacteriota bacterium]